MLVRDDDGDARICKRIGCWGGEVPFSLGSLVFFLVFGKPFRPFLMVILTINKETIKLNMASMLRSFISKSTTRVTTQQICSRNFGASPYALPASAKSQELMDLDRKYGAKNYDPIEVVLARGKGALAWDVDGKEYLDFLSAYSAVNQGHCHPKIVEAMTKQLSTLTLTSRAFFNSELPGTLEYISNYFGYDRALMMNTGVEAVESALKIARKWGYQVKGIPPNQAKLVFCTFFSV